jgi:hypothetical protein
MVETYSWFVSGFHNPLFVYTADTANGYTTEYYTQNISLGITANTTPAMDLQLFPNPATNVINLKFNLTDNSPASVTLSDLTGRIVRTVSSNKLNPGNNELCIPVDDLPDGMYIVRLQAPGEIVTRKVGISN